VLLGYRQLKKMYVFPWVTLIFFIIVFIEVLILNNMWVAMHLGILSYATLAGIAWVFLLLGHPFTMDYGKDLVDESMWKTKVFMRTNQVITAFWGVIFTINLAINYSKQNYMGSDGLTLEIAGWVFLVIGMLFTVEYRRFVRRRRRKSDMEIIN
jgi:hypothetical protein